jgi:hypothetical protein
LRQWNSTMTTTLISVTPVEVQFMTHVSHPQTSQMRYTGAGGKLEGTDVVHRMLWGRRL